MCRSMPLPLLMLRPSSTLWSSSLKYLHLITWHTLLISWGTGTDPLDIAQWNTPYIDCFVLLNKLCSFHLFSPTSCNNEKCCYFSLSDLLFGGNNLDSWEWDVDKIRTACQKCTVHPSMHHFVPSGDTWICWCSSPAHTGGKGWECTVDRSLITLTLTPGGAFSL